MFGVFAVWAMLIGGVGHNINVGTVALNDHAPFVHIDESKGVIEYTYPTGDKH